MRKVNISSSIFVHEMIVVVTNGCCLTNCLHYFFWMVYLVDHHHWSSTPCTFWYGDCTWQCVSMDKQVQCYTLSDIFWLILYRQEQTQCNCMVFGVVKMKEMIICGIRRAQRGRKMRNTLQWNLLHLHWKSIIDTWFFYYGIITSNRIPKRVSPT